MIIKRKRNTNVPLTHSNLTMDENLQSLYDPNGSWTGVPMNIWSPKITDGDLPVQDADDL